MDGLCFQMLRMAAATKPTRLVRISNTVRLCQLTPSVHEATTRDLLPHLLDLDGTPSLFLMIDIRGGPEEPLNSAMKGQNQCR